MSRVDATELTADALTKLAAGNVWSASRTVSATQRTTWKWMADGTVCMWQGPPDGKCADDGTWRVVDTRICYQLTWWLKTYDLTAACFSVIDMGKGNYEARLPSGSLFLAFVVEH
jgi:hypothetical protein